jgi:hypothetical protein
MLIQTECNSRDCVHAQEWGWEPACKAVAVQQPSLQVVWLCQHRPCTVFGQTTTALVIL